MALLHAKNPGNVPGPFYVDESCIDCDLCRETAPATFRRNEEIGMTVAYHQPVTADELALALAAMERCPTDSIGNEGEAFNPSVESDPRPGGDRG